MDSFGKEENLRLTQQYFRPCKLVWKIQFLNLLIYKN